ncbi:MAG: efflux transporter outer membrane subunit [Leptothrix sp. (in: b-proteobacteria)]
MSAQTTLIVRHAPRLLPLLSALLLAACSTTPVAPPALTAAPAPTQFKESVPAPGQTSPAAEVPDAWWQLFHDPVLDDLQARLVIGNENLKLAIAQVDSARAVLGASRAAQQPTLSAGASASRADSGGNSGPQNALSLNANAAWELDLWGRLSEATRSNEARYQASQADLAAARLSAQATLTQTYFALRAAEAQQAVIERSITGYQRSLELTEVRYQGGVAALSDVLQAKTQLKTAQVQLIEAGSQRAQAEHAIAVLLGQPPSALALSAATPAALPEPPPVPTLLPSTLLQRRPDIRAAERRVTAAYAQIGVADASVFPSLSLSASGGLRSSSLGQLFNPSSLIWSLGSALTQKLLDGGAQQAVVEQARASADQAGASYRQTVLLAFQEVEDNLMLTDRLQAEAELQREALQLALRNLEITQDQYRVGTVSYLNVVTAQTTALSSERTLLDVQTRQLGAANQLLKNIAGRW